MEPSPASMPDKIYLDCGRYLVRTLTVDDASARWGRWLADPEASHMLNAPPKVLSKKQIVDYIKVFDQRSHLLLGIFVKVSGQHVGFVRIDIDFALGRFLPTLLIGEPAYRRKGIMTIINIPVLGYMFETLGLKTALATALGHNRLMINSLRKSGWNLDKTVKAHVKSNADGSPLDLCFFSLTRDAWRAWKAANLSARAARVSAVTPKA